MQPQMPILDAHCHIYPDKIACKAAKSIGDFYHIPMNLDGRVSTLLETGSKAGITRYLVHSVATFPAQVRSINEFLAEQVGLHSEFIGFGTLHPQSLHLKRDFDHLLELGLKGIKLHPDVQQFDLDSEEALRIYRLAEGRVPLLVHTGDHRYDYSHPRRLKRVMDAFEGLTVIAAHLGGWSMWEEAQNWLPGTKNLYVDCSSSLYALEPERARELFEAFGMNHVLFGTDYPMWRPEEELQRLFQLHLAKEDLQNILYGNAAALLGL